MNNLATISQNLPINKLPEDKLNGIIFNEFTVWIANLLSLTDETSADRLLVSLPAIKDHCWSMGFDEITKMFEMYADNKLNIKPIPNYFDRILLGKIVDCYKKQRPKKTTVLEAPKKSTEEIDEIMVNACDRIFQEYLRGGNFSGMVSHIYDYLDSKGLVPIDVEYKQKIFQKAKATVRVEEKNEAKLDFGKHQKLEVTLTKIENGLNGRVFEVSKKLVLLDVFRKWADEGVDILEILK